eukprot:m.187925 g.187925  ORF g.187925 m.187925 type:complete len:115 (-) comp18516_c0_seq1:195-539(-)
MCLLAPTADIFNRFCGHTEIIQLLLERQADPSMQDSDGHTALHKAVMGAHVDAVKALLAAETRAGTSGKWTLLTDTRGRQPRDLVCRTNEDGQSLSPSQRAVLVLLDSRAGSAN